MARLGFGNPPAANARRFLAHTQERPTRARTHSHAHAHKHFHSRSNTTAARAHVAGKVWNTCNNWYMKTTHDDKGAGREKASTMWFETYGLCKCAAKDQPTCHRRSILRPSAFIACVVHFACTSTTHNAPTTCMCLSQKLANNVWL